VSALEVDVAGHVGVGVGALTVAAAFRTNDAPLVVVGPNGAGKTSLLMMILGAATPTRGRVSLAGATLYDRDAGVDVPVERRGIGFLPQRYALFPHLDALHNVAYGIAAPSRAARLDLAREALRELDVAPLAARRPAELSGGEAQRVALARALAHRPRALVLDEPLAALDVGVRRDVRRFLAERLRAWRLPTVVVTHDPADAEALDGDVLVLERGAVTQSGRLADLRRAPRTDFVRHFTADVAGP
jgi:molybdate transport system ATP-binding protein